MLKHLPDSLLDTYDPYFLWSPKTLTQTTQAFIKHFPGLVSYAVKANSHVNVLTTLHNAGIHTWDTASPWEVAEIKRLFPNDTCHHHNPVRGKRETQALIDAGIRHFSVDSESELNTLLEHKGIEEISVRLHLDIQGGTYNFGSKFGVSIDTCMALLTTIRAHGIKPSITFHPGTQCLNVDAWTVYLSACSQIVEQAGPIHRINVGGGFPCDRGDDTFSIESWAQSLRQAAEHNVPNIPLVCEPGRGLVGNSWALVTRVRARRTNDTVFLNDGIYGGLSESISLNAPTPLVFSAKGELKDNTHPFTVFGPTCDSVDRLPNTVMLPETVAEDDIVLFPGMGAYSWVTATQFNGFGPKDIVTIDDLV